MSGDDDDIHDEDDAVHDDPMYGGEDGNDAASEDGFGDDLDGEAADVRATRLGTFLLNFALLSVVSVVAFFVILFFAASSAGPRWTRPARATG